MTLFPAHAKSLASQCRRTSPRSSRRRQLWLTDWSQLMQLKANRVPSVMAAKNIAQALSDRTRRENRVASAKEVVAEIPKTVAQRADPVTLGSRSVGAIVCLQADKYFWEYGVDPQAGFWWKRKETNRIPKEEAIDRWYLLQSPLSSGSFARKAPHSLSATRRGWNRPFPSSKSPGSPSCLSWARGDPSPQSHRDLFPRLLAHRPPPNPIDLERLPRTSRPNPLVAFTASA
ncbi:hypothetical protein MPNT_120009 [Candidatus Methylacidithermus pantelleriae]|uniref:Uncharacterized protein n=1 Tax=Candidatus Methylacidithermus pantelleriae TaxID=2744239 RepID=A0A8J2FS00_9BACT|nr:hypothetical protein MPNT_120009 [Candidatus Methylacidithermus pantelleriae]